MPIVWSSSYNTGVRSIDLQHQELIEMINALDAIRGRPIDQQALGFLMNQLGQYVVFHFGHEEALMEQIFVPPQFKEEHLKAHAAFTAQVQAQSSRLLSNGGVGALDSLVEYLNAWLLNHIKQTDMELAERLNKSRPGRMW